MGKEQTPQITKRTTRSSLAMQSKSTCETVDITDHLSSPSISNDLLFTQEPLTLDNLLSKFPGRRPQILEILRLIGPQNSPMIPVFLYGGVSTGKTSIILQIFRYLNRPFLYSSCRSCYSPRILFEYVLNQLLRHKRKASNGYSNAKRCERFSDFVNYLREALVQVIKDIKEYPKKTGQKETAKRGNGRMVYLIFDNVELIRDWDKNSTIIPSLFKLFDILNLPEVGLIFISSSTPDTYYSSTGFQEPLPVYFQDYTEDELYQIFMRNQINWKLYSSFLDAVLKPFYRITRRVDELSIALRPLFQKYCEPLSDLDLVPDENLKRRLFSQLQPHIAPSLNQIYKVSSPFSVEPNKDKVRKKGTNRNLGSETSDVLDFHISSSAKYLLISAFLASRNPATLDEALFDSTGGTDNRKRKRKSSEISMQKKDDIVQEQLMKGPGTFPLERLLAIFQCITLVGEGSLEEEQHDEQLVAEGGASGLMSDVLLQLSTLCNANFISKGGSCPLEGSTRYRSTVDEEMALKVARSVNFPLSKYLYRR